MVSALNHCVAYRPTAGEELMESLINRLVRAGVHSALIPVSGQVLQPSDHFHGPPKDSLQQLHVFLMLRVRDGRSTPAQATVGLLGCERTLPAHVQLFIHQYPQVLFRRAALENLMRFIQAHFSSLSRSLWMTSRTSGMSTAPLSLVSSANFLRVHLISLSMSSMKILNSEEELGIAGVKGLTRLKY
ncbi:hypothetical protein QYF61_007394 [Mycteria americana]|uniref:Uncharacterized protein n=1 Tax=Mycteria americana TaxID=33587 RepID=A0AAN7MPV7_MYCAM|nr:hypothetical protein QYF61_007394 [Mycteria americana]